MISDKASVSVTDEAYNDKNHEDDISSYGRHGVYEGRGKLSERGTTGICWRNGRLVKCFNCPLTTVLRTRKPLGRCYSKVYTKQITQFLQGRWLLGSN